MEALSPAVILFLALAGTMALLHPANAKVSTMV